MNDRIAAASSRSPHFRPTFFIFDRTQQTNLNFLFLLDIFVHKLRTNGTANANSHCRNQTPGKRPFGQSNSFHAFGFGRPLPDDQLGQHFGIQFYNCMAK